MGEVKGKEGQKETTKCHYNRIDEKKFCHVEIML